MNTITDYQIISKLYESPNSLVYRAILNQNNQPIILKILKEGYPSASEITRYRQEYEVTRSLNLDGVIKAYSLHRYQNSLVMLLEDFGGDSLNILLNKYEFSLEEFLVIAIKITNALGGIHANSIIHKDINPSNIVYNLKTGQLKIIDFGISTVLSRENLEIYNPNYLEGTLAYISPEQTGRMNRAIDYRTDFYSLGVTFYQILTHQLPFATNDAIELVHSHIAKQPVPPHKHNSKIPLAVSKIIMKLLAKIAEERYQSAWGLRADLEYCLQQLQVNNQILEFPLALRDVSDKFQIPQHLYGREKEVEQLLETFERVSQGKTEMMLVSGYSGVGKSALINEIHKPIVRQRGYFISGKFEQFKRNIPYVCLIQALQELIRQLLTESEIQIQSWKQKLLNALGENCQVIIDVIPEVELIVDKQPPVPQLGSIESQNRFNLVFQKFISVFTQPEHPLVIFLDDLQWADSASLNLIKLLMTNTDNQYLLMLGAYRDNEVSVTHPLMLTLEQIQQVGTKISKIKLQPLSLIHVNQLIADTVNKSTKETQSLAELVIKKTNGNPFFLTQLLQGLYRDELLSFDSVAGNWSWDIEQIQAVDITDNVVEFMITKLEKLKKNTQNILKLSACIGNIFNLELLALINGKSLAETAADLWPALQEGLIIPLNDAYKIPILWNQEVMFNSCSETLPFPIPYKFLHDRVQQAAYALIPDLDKQKIHLQVGSILKIHTKQEELEEKIFDIVNHLNISAELITDRTPKDELARLNLIAGKKAKASAAYEPALRYLENGIRLLSPDSWQSQYKLTLELYTETVEALYINSQFPQADELYEIVLTKAQTLLDKVKLYELKIDSHQVQNQQKEAIKTALETLNLLGVKLLTNPRFLKLVTFLNLLQTKIALIGKNNDYLINQPEMTDPLKQAAVTILSYVDSAAYVAQPELYSLIALKPVNLLLKYGNTPQAPIVYAMYAVVLCAIDDIQAAIQFSELSSRLLERYDTKIFKAKLLFYHNYIRHWHKPINNIAKLFLEAYKSAVENGDVLWAGYNAHQYSLHLFWSGQDLRVLEKELGKYSKAIEKIKQYTSLNYNNLYHQSVLNLIGESATPHLLSGRIYNEDKMIQVHHLANDRLALADLYLQKTLLCLIFEKYTAAFENSLLAVEYADAFTASLSFPLVYFYNSLTCLATVTDQSLQKTQLVLVEKNQKRMKRWASYGSSNYQNKYDFIEAEKARVLGKNFKAMKYYDLAIVGARKQGFIQDEAMICERAAKFYFSINANEIAQFYLKNAHHCYTRWGAIAKVKDLEAKYPQILVGTTERKGIKEISTTISNNGSNAQVLDLATVIKASQALAGEIVLEKLLKKLMKIVIENAGAQKGFLILDQPHSWVIEAEGMVDKDEVTVLQSVPIDSLDPNLKIPYVSAAIINYVARSQENVVLNDAVHEGQFTRDPYIAAAQPKSILCTPLLHQGKLSGILYLENNLTTGAFTPDRVEVLRILSAQAAISIENSRLYEQLEEYNRNLEQKVEARTQELQDKNQELATTLQKLKTTQAQIIAQEKLASLGTLTAGIAHEIKNPLNFVNNFAELSVELTEELLEEINHQKDKLDAENKAYIEELLHDLNQNSQKIKEHGQRADSIVHGMLMHSQGQTGKRQPTDINAVLTESVNLVYQSMRAKNPNFQLAIETKYADHLGQLNLVIQNISRVFINIINNACYAVNEKTQAMGGEFLPQICLSTHNLESSVEIRIRDNGNGISEDIIDKIFHPFFTTKPPGQGTGLGLSISHEIIVQEHQGNIKVETEVGLYTEFIITLPKDSVE
ncbi:MAG TPA: AAA family ATPase [Nostocaceae cyanobacterium]|nr:AAA family ATPase [Nostocaceae cyanobacterium]